MRIKKGDQVKIITGKDRGKTGSVLRALPKEQRVIIEGINLYKKRTKPRKRGEKGEVVLVPRPLDASNVMLICKNCKKATRVGKRIEGNQTSRYCKKCKAVT